MAWFLGFHSIAMGINLLKNITQNIFRYYENRERKVIRDLENITSAVHAWSTSKNLSSKMN